MYLLDTNVVSELRKPAAESCQVLEMGDLKGRGRISST